MASPGDNLAKPDITPGSASLPKATIDVLVLLYSTLDGPTNLCRAPVAIDNTLGG